MLRSQAAGSAARAGSPWPPRHWQATAAAVTARGRAGPVRRAVLLSRGDRDFTQAYADAFKLVPDRPRHEAGSDARASEPPT